MDWYNDILNNPPDEKKKVSDHYYISEHQGLTTIRKYPENYWLASIKEDNIVFDSFDSKAVDYSKEELISFYEKVKAFKLDNSKLAKSIQDSIAVIVETDGILGVQYWKEWEIKNLWSENTDRSISKFISKL